MDGRHAVLAQQLVRPAQQRVVRGVVDLQRDRAGHRARRTRYLTEIPHTLEAPEQAFGIVTPFYFDTVTFVCSLQAFVKAVEIRVVVILPLKFS